ncbi:MAG: hypothetical protein R3B82_17790 [Sandaracinaceae bacterium]
MHRLRVLARGTSANEKGSTEKWYVPRVAFASPMCSKSSPAAAPRSCSGPSVVKPAITPSCETSCPTRTRLVAEASSMIEITVFRSRSSVVLVTWVAGSRTSSKLDSHHHVARWTVSFAARTSSATACQASSPLVIRRTWLPRRAGRPCAENQRCRAPRNTVWTLSARPSMVRSSCETDTPAPATPALALTPDSPPVPSKVMVAVSGSCASASSRTS